ncbi:flagellar basal body P-ring formation protein FlgA [Epibacterium sp. SM1969]|uniref:Flagella basal body P-ring formation protein FlgA n=1 Tax=Tritonibacter aquimaris TaxID=2663379 RepID=A0A844AUA4_9RHOB|nr:flagellar basal body P-ring formation chaperone FlgA [Tritonibacter aquimaris]MQY41984.1 flagellar basal body P-ring formation protein FlgA [Tritonibacter aquimaris]
MKLALALFVSLIAQSAIAEIIVPVRNIRPKEIIAPSDLTHKQVSVVGAIAVADELVGQEARVALYAGRPIRPGDFGPPAIIERNDLVTLRFRNGSLTIATEGRALGRGAEGESIRVMNLSSRTTVSGRVKADGSIEVN